MSSPQTPVRSLLLVDDDEALLQVPTDLHIFMELNVANDIVEDVFSVFEEVEQKPGSRCPEQSAETASFVTGDSKM